MMEKTHTAQSLVKFVKGQPIDFFQLVDERGQSIVGWNRLKKDKSDHLKQVEAILNSEILPDGVYFLNWRSNTRAAAQSIPVRKGKASLSEKETATPAAPVRAAAPVVMGEGVRSFNDALADKARIKELELENADLKKQLAEFIEDEGEELAEGEELETTNKVVSFIQDYGLPLIDKYFQLREREIELLGARVPVIAPEGGPGRVSSRPIVNPNDGQAASAPKAAVNYGRVSPSQFVRPAATAPAPTPAQGYSPSSGGGGGGGGWDSAAPSEEKTPQTSEEQQIASFLTFTPAADVLSWLQEQKQQLDADTFAALSELVLKYRSDGVDLLSALQ